MRDKLIFSLLIVASFAISSYAQTSEQVVPMDTSIRYGVLPNGMTYFVRKAINKKNIAEFRLVQKTGSLVEEDSERGIAHFLEHMMFRGTKHFPNTEILDFLRRIGVNFGPDVNALTTFNETRYMLSDVPLTSEGRIDSCLQILRDWSGDATISQEALDAERNVVVEEWRARYGHVGADIGQSIIDSLYVGSRYAERNPIGDMEVIRKCSAKQMRAFYKRWYQPQNQCVIAAGDFDPDKVTEKIKQLFSDLKGDGVPAPVYDIPKVKDGPMVVISRSKDVPMAMMLMFIPQDETSKEDIGKVKYFKQKEAEDQVVKEIRKKLSDLKKENPQILLTMVQTLPMMGNTTRNMYSTIVAMPVSSWKETTSKVLQEIESIKRNGIKREKFIDGAGNEIWTDEDTTVIEWKDTLQHSENYLNAVDAKGAANNCVEHFMLGTTGISPQTKAILDKYVANHMTTKFLKETANRAFDARKGIIAIVVPDNPETISPKAEEVKALLDEVANKDYALDTLKKENNKKKHFDISPIPGKVVEKKDFSNPDFVQYTLSNGVTVVMSKKHNGLRMTNLYTYAKGGESLLENNEMPYLEFLKSSVSSFDDYEHLACLKWVKPFGVNYEFSCDYVGNNLEDMFKFFYVTMTTTEVDSNKFAKEMTKQRIGTEMPKTDLVEAMTNIMSFPYVSDARNFDYTTSMLDTMSIDGMKAILARLHSNYNGLMVMIDNSLDPDSLLPYIEKYVASLPSKPQKLNCIDRKERHFKTYDDVFVKHIEDKVPKADVSMFIGWEKDCIYNEEQYAHMDALKSVLNQLLINRIRIQHSDIYSIAVIPKFEQYPTPQMLFILSFVCNPDKEEIIRKDIKQLFKDMAEGDAITQQLLDGYVNSKNKSAKKGKDKDKVFISDLFKDYTNGGVDTNNPEAVNSVSVQSLKSFTQKLFKNSHIYEYILTTNEQK